MLRSRNRVFAPLTKVLLEGQEVFAYCGYNAHLRMVIWQEKDEVSQWRSSPTSGAVLIFALQPLTAIWVTNYARHTFEKTYEDIRKDAQSLQNSQDKPDDSGMAPAAMLMLANGLYDMPDFNHIDSFCGTEKKDDSSDDSPFANSPFKMKEDICASYEKLQTGDISRTIALAISPIVPILMTLAATATLVKRQRKKNLRSGVAAWILLKGLNKLIALQAVPFGIAIGLGCWAIGLHGYWAAGAGLLVAIIFAAMQAATVEMYTEGVLVMELEYEPEPPKPASTVT